MRFRKAVVYVMTAFFLSLAAFFGYNQMEWEPFPFSVVITGEEGSEEIKCWKKVPDTFYVFIPSYADLEQAYLRLNQFHKVYLDGRLLEEGMTCADFPLEVPLEMSYTDGGENRVQTVVFMHSANVASMYIDVPSGSMEYIHEEKGNEEPGTMRLYDAEGGLWYSGGLESIKGRGNATWEDAKKPYSLKLSREADLFGMGEASRWILLSNSGDYSHMRNKLSYDLADAVNLPYSPECMWTDVYLNGEYAGLYLLSERNEIHPQRVNIDANGSFLVSIEPEWRLQLQGYPYVATDSGIAFRIYDSTIRDDVVRDIWQSAENAILAENGIDPLTGKSWDELIDVDSWVRKYLIEEILANIDSGVASEFFFYEETDGKLYAGPIWDMDVILHGGSLECISPSAILAGRPHLRSETDVHFFYALLQKDAFMDRVVELYQQEFYPLLTRLLDSGLEEYARQTEQAAALNQARWSLGNAGESTAKLRVFLEERMRFLDDYWVNEEPYYLIQAQRDNSVWAFAVPPGEVLDYLPTFEGEQWYRRDTEEPFDRTAPVEKDILIYARQISAEEGQADFP